jgi:hypothetical protein
MIERVQSLWIGNELSKLELLCLKSFLRHGHQFDLFLYKEISGIPDGVNVRDANEIIPESSIFTTKGSYAIYSDFFRWKLLYDHGGVWVDMDLICLRPFDFTDKYLYGKEIADRANTAVLGFPAKDEFCLAMKEACENPLAINEFDPPKLIKRKRKCSRLFRKKDPNEYIHWGHIGGPHGFTNALKHYGMFDLAKPFINFYPIHPENWDAFFLSGIYPEFNIEAELFPKTYAIHVWNEFFRRFNVDKNTTFKSDSLFEKLKKIYL